MSGGGKRIVINSRERAISPDINRLQAFAGADLAELLRYMFNTSANDDKDAGAVVTENTTQENPLRGEIVNGLLMRPVAGSLNLLVDPGVAMLLDPDAGADDSNYKYVRDPGVTALGALTIGGNVSGFTRVDIVEVQDASAVIETDSRDIFNPVTSLFSATTVTKATAQRLTYRVRAGTPGAGIPVTAQGWLPIAVASVPNGAASVDVMTFWDVRPLLSDRAFQPFPLTVDKPYTSRLEINALSLSAVAGVVDAVIGTDGGLAVSDRISGRRIGGRLRRGTPGTDADSIDATAPVNQESGFVVSLNRPWYLFLCFPAGLPRWARYTDGPSGRVPRSPRGIPIVGMGTPPDTTGSQLVSLASTVFGAITPAPGYVVAAGYVDNTGTLKGFYGDQHGTILQSAAADNFGTAAATNPLEVAGTDTTAGGAGKTTYSLTAAGQFPPHARAILCEFRANVQTGNTDATTDIPIASLVIVHAPNGGGQAASLGGPSLTQSGSTAETLKTHRFTMWIPLATVYPSLTAPTQVIDVQYNQATGGADVLAVTGRMRVLGWRF